jgi:hypothetical protein
LRVRQEAAMPLSKENLRHLLDMLDEAFSASGDTETGASFCDHTLKRTRAFLLERHLPEDEVVAWLAEYGGFCDCEVLANVGEVWEERVGSN